jgi:hypothetical protein
VFLPRQKASDSARAKALCRSPDYADRKRAWLSNGPARMGQRLFREVIRSA